MHPKLAHGTCLDGFDFLWLLVAFEDSLLLLHTTCRERHTVWCTFRRVLAGSYTCEHMFTCASLRHIRFCGEQEQVN